MEMAVPRVGGRQMGRAVLSGSLRGFSFAGAE